MDKKFNWGRLGFVRQSSLAPEGKDLPGLTREQSQKLLTAEQLEATLQLLYHACKGNVDGVKSMLAEGVDVNSVDFDGRTALHLAACEGKVEVVELLLRSKANVNQEDRWGSTPLADALHYGNLEVTRILEAHGCTVGSQSRNSLMRMSSIDVPEYEIDRSQLVFEDDHPNMKGGNYRVASWQGTLVCVKILPGEISTNVKRILRFKDELALLLKLRHPNVVQFLGAVTQTSPMMIVTEFLSGGDLSNLVVGKSKKLDSATALAFALDIARGLNFLHEFKPKAIIHGDLKPSNLLRDQGGHVKVADFGLSQTTSGPYSAVEDSASVKKSRISCRYMAPEIFRKDKYDRSVDVFSFGLIVQEMLEGHSPFPDLTSEEAAKAYANEDRRPPFKHSGRGYPPFLKDLIMECWDKDPLKRPPFGQIIIRLEDIQVKTSWKAKIKNFFARG